MLLAAVHNSRRLACRCGLLPWRSLLLLRQQQLQHAIEWHARSLLRHAYEALGEHVQHARWARICREACLAAQRRLDLQRAWMAAGLDAFSRNLQRARASAALAHSKYQRRLVSQVCAPEEAAHVQ
jgi:hypothetical protein